MRLRRRLLYAAGSEATSTIWRVLPQADVARVRRLCEGRVPDHVLDEVRVELEERPRTLTIVECRAPWREDYRPEWCDPRLPV